MLYSISIKSHKRRRSRKLKNNVYAFYNNKELVGYGSGKTSVEAVDNAIAEAEANTRAKERAERLKKTLTVKQLNAINKLT
jgi:putative aminopeptidase FrvX